MKTPECAFKCGHSFTKVRFSATGQFCDACLKRKEEIADFKICDEAKLPELHGSAMQIVWAAHIRARLWLWTMKQLEHWQSRFAHEPYHRINIQMEIRNLKVWVRSIRGSFYKRRADWWIERAGRESPILYAEFWHDREKRRAQREETPNAATGKRPD